MLSHLWQNAGRVTPSQPVGFQALSAPDSATRAIER